MNTLILDGMELLFHRAPEGTEYWCDDFKSGVKRIWVQNRRFQFTYTGDDSYPSSVWGFYKPKTGKFYAPINHKKMGKEVDIKDTSPWTAMQLNLNPLMAAFS